MRFVWSLSRNNSKLVKRYLKKMRPFWIIMLPIWLLKSDWSRNWSSPTQLKRLRWNSVSTKNSVFLSSCTRARRSQIVVWIISRMKTNVSHHFFFFLISWPGYLHHIHLNIEERENAPHLLRPETYPFQLSISLPRILSFFFLIYRDSTSGWHQR